MKLQKLLLSAITACLLVGASGAVMAQSQRNDCPFGTISGGTFDEIVIRDFVSCNITGVTVEGRIRVADADTITIKDSRIDGGVRVTNTVSIIVLDNQVVSNLVTRDNRFSTLVANTVENGDIRVLDTADGTSILANIVWLGDMRVNRNGGSVNVKQNFVTGDLTCRDNGLLDEFANRVLGDENCRR